MWNRNSIESTFQYQIYGIASASFAKIVADVAFRFAQLVIDVVKRRHLLYGSDDCYCTAMIRR